MANRRRVKIKAHRRADGTKVKGHTRIIQAVKKLGSRIAHMGKRANRTADIKQRARVHRGRKNSRRAFDMMLMRKR